MTSNELHSEFNEFNEWVRNDCNGNFDTACKKLGIHATNIKTWKRLYNYWVERKKYREYIKEL